LFASFYSLHVHDVALAAAPSLVNHIKVFFQSIRDDVPRRDTHGRFMKPLDPVRHPNSMYSLPNPTTAAVFDPLSKGLNKFQPEQFHALFTRLIVFAPHIYFHHLGEAAVRCPLQ
jgi:hypothetical protein